MKIIPLSEGSFTIDRTKQFVPFDEGQHQLNDRPTGSLLVEVQPFALVTDRDIILLDTGLGFEDSTGRPQIHSNLLESGIGPGDITKVLITHLHKDHAGGITCGENRSRLCFSNARHYVQEREFREAMEKGEPSYIPRELEALRDSDRLQLLGGDHGHIDDYIEYRVTGAHSVFHQVFWIRSEGETIFFGGDDAPQIQQMKIRYRTKYDHDAGKAAKLRELWWEQGNREGWTFLFYHDTRLPVHRGSGSGH